MGRQGGLHPAPRAVRVLRVDGQPAPPGPDVAAGGRTRHPDVHQRQAQVRHRQPPVRHERLRQARVRHRGGTAQPEPAPGGQLPQGGRATRTATPPTPTRSTSSSSSSTRSTRCRRPRTGRAPRSSSPTTTPTAGTTTPSAASPTPPRRAADALTGTGACGSGQPLAGQQGRCGYGPRLPLLVISPWARANFVDDTLTDQASIIRFIEDNWRLGADQGVVRFRVAQPEPDVQLRPQAREEQGPAARPHHGSAPEEDRLAPSPEPAFGWRECRRTSRPAALVRRLDQRTTRRTAGQGKQGLGMAEYPVRSD